MALKVGDRVMVFNTSMGGKRITEGEATIVKLSDTRDQYEVRFKGDFASETYLRFCQEENKVKRKRKGKDT